MPTWPDAGSCSGCGRAAARRWPGRGTRRVLRQQQSDGRLHAATARHVGLGRHVAGVVEQLGRLRLDPRHVGLGRGQPTLRGGELDRCGVVVLGRGLRLRAQGVELRLHLGEGLAGVGRGLAAGHQGADDGESGDRGDERARDANGQRASFPLPPTGLADGLGLGNALRAHLVVTSRFAPGNLGSPASERPEGRSNSAELLTAGARSIGTCRCETTSRSVKFRAASGFRIGPVSTPSARTGGVT